MPNPILLVEDNPYDRDLTQSALEKCAISSPVIAVSDGEEALDYLLRRASYANRPIDNPALVLLDLRLPKVDGIDVLKTMRSNPDLASIPVIMLTHSALDADVHRTKILGIDKYIIKPIDLQTFIADVCTVVKLYGE